MVYCDRQTHSQYYLQPLSIRGHLRDLVVDPVDKVCITGRQEAVLREEERMCFENELSRTARN